MIYNEEFVWLHFPKCAGTKVEQLFSRYLCKQGGVTLDSTNINVDPLVTWHDSIAEREDRDPGFKLGDRTVVCSIRRLPSWLISRYDFEFQRSPKLPHVPGKLLEGRFLEATGFENHADYYVKKYLPETLLKSGKVRFLRTEFFESDFKSIFGGFLDISKIPDSEYQRSVNASKSYLPMEIKREIQSSSEKIYDKCPCWRKVEGFVYGSSLATRDL